MCPRHVRRDDLMSAGMMALVLSAAAYDPSRGVPFQSFAAFRIRGALIDELRAMDWASRSVRGRAREVETVRARLTTTAGPTTGHRRDRRRPGDQHPRTRRRVRRPRPGQRAEPAGLATDALPDAPANHAECPESLILHREQLGYLHDAVAALPRAAALRGRRLLLRAAPDERYRRRSVRHPIAGIADVHRGHRRSFATA